MAETGPEHVEAPVLQPPPQVEEAAVAQRAGSTMLAEVTPLLPVTSSSTDAAVAPATTAVGDTTGNSTRRDTPVTDLRGKVCRTQPGEGQVPVLEAGKKTPGCSYADAPEFNTVNLYALAQQQTVRMSVISSLPGKRTMDSGGSGVIIGKSDSECFVATANHVVSGYPGETVTSRSAITADGRQFPAAMRIQDPGKDIAVVALQTGAATDAVCKPATFAKDASYRGPAVAFGFPEGTTALHASPGRLTTVQTFAEQLKAMRAKVDARDRGLDDMQRPMAVMTGQVKGGQSGGPLYNGGPEVSALVQGGAHTRSFGATVLTAPMVEDYMRRLRRS